MGPTSVSHGVFVGFVWGSHGAREGLVCVSLRACVRCMRLRWARVELVWGSQEAGVELACGFRGACVEPLLAAVC